MASLRPSAPEVPLETWRDLLAAAQAFRAARPWDWMDDSDLFVLVDEEGRPFFPSVLGAAGQVFGLALYRGEEGLRFLFDAMDTLEEHLPETAFRQDALLLDWGAKKALAPEDLAVLAALGHAPRPRERQAWPCFRSHAPGWFPWFLDAAEARALARGTRALLACAELARRDEDFFAPNDEDGRVLPTVDIAATLAGSLDANQVEWRHWRLPPPAPPPPPSIRADWAAVRTRPLNPRGALEFDIFHLRSPVADSGRPYFPRLALLVDGASGYVYGMEMAPPERAWGDLVVSTWSKAWQTATSRPATIAIRREEWLPALLPLAEHLGIKVELRAELPFIEEARESLGQFQGR
ncbi:MAG: hypothetical protein HYX71_06160 [Opitutae bacterium]|nr:hypothetical protein [Opitutae bacterium]